MKRRKFLKNSSLVGFSMLLAPSVLYSQVKKAGFISVLGPVRPENLGTVLIHEHIMVDFIGASETGAHRYNPEEVVEVVLPHLRKVREAGCKTFVDCTPAYLGRDVHILRRLAQETGMNILTNTGYYGAREGKYLPSHAYSEDAEQLAARWIAEWNKGIDGSGIRPGFIKTGVDAGPLTTVNRKLLEAAAVTHLQTGLSISAHTGNGEAAMEELSILEKAGVAPEAFRWVHAQIEKDKDLHLKAAKMGAYVEFDGIRPDSVEEHVEFVKFMRDHDLLEKTLVSQDAGWYSVGEPKGGDFASFTTIFEKFVPRLKEEGFTPEEIRQLLEHNPRESLRIRVRKI